ncbi:ImpA family metalloprotease [Colwellia sp. 75C3]|uniref:ImpA family metalloprotease n=1 Tax=Colwellia sp. 75C3 TaxID=888425 RepID=UPI0018E3D720|nr:ImpA family metalloprotease [Colwellia sp. 75C3]
MLTFRNPLKKCIFLLLCLSITSCGGSDEESTEPANPIPTTPDTANIAPVISGTPTVATVGTNYTFTPTLSDSDGDDVILGSENLPAWLTLDTTGIKGTASVDDIGEHNLVLTASDAKSTIRYEITISVIAIPEEEKEVKPENNKAPKLSGIPNKAVVEQAFSFTPVATDENNDELAFSATNLPSWLTVDGTTGEMTGTPQLSDLGSFRNIELTVSDGVLSTSITVAIYVVNVPVVNQAPTISGTANNVITEDAFSFAPIALDKDNDILTFSATGLPLWLSIDNTTGEITGTPGLNDVGILDIKLTVSDGALSVSLSISITVIERNLAPTISGIPSEAVIEQAFTFTPSAADENNDVLSFSVTNQPTWLSINSTTGEMTGTPQIGDSGISGDIELVVSDGKLSTSLSISINIRIFPELTTLIAQAVSETLFNFDLRNKAEEKSVVTYSASSLPSWLTLDRKTGILSGTPAIEHVGETIIPITLDDGVAQRTSVFTIYIDDGSLDLAIATGNTLVIAESDSILNAALVEIDSHKVRFNEVKRQLFQLDSTENKLTAIDWDPSHDAAILYGQYPFNDTVLNTNSSYQAGGIDRVLPIAIAGSKTTDTGRYLAFGGNPFRNGKNAQMEQFLHNSFDWLTQKKSTELAEFKVIFTQLDESHWFKDRSQTRAWFDNNVTNVSYNDAGVCDGTKLADCIANKPDLIIISRIARSGDDKAAIIQSVKNALAQNIPVIYLQHDGGIGEHGRELLSVFNITHGHDNYWWKLRLQAFDPSTLTDGLPSDILNIRTLLTNFKNNFFDVDLTGCSVRNCPAESNVQSEFFDGANATNAMFNIFNSQKINIFNSEDYRLNKLLILLADHYRQTVSYPMDKLTTDTVDFFKSLYADYAIYNTRDINPVQPDMGNFSRSDFSHITPESANVSLTSKPSFRSAGVYALPGQTFTVTRTDNNIADTSIFINTLRTGATHIFNGNKYNRPYLLQSNRLTITSGETIRFTSSYGGPIQIGFSQKDIEVSFTFTNIGRHPHWRTPADDIVFAQQMDKGDYDWAEIATEGFEVHSKLTKLRASLSGSIWPVASDFANATYRYTHNKVHVLAGFKGPGIDVVPEIHDFVTNRGLSVDTIDIVKHMNADQPTCGWGCSGNPYDAGWNFSPTGHGDLHELGHGIERGSMRFEGYGGHSNTNFYSYFSKSIYEDETGESASCQGLPFETMFNTLQQSKLAADPALYMQEKLSKSWSEHHALYIQLMMAAQAEGTITNGWYLYPRMHIWDREMWRLDNSIETWAAGKVALGFNDYTLEEFKVTSQNERLFISLSEITQLNLSDWFAMYGFELSAKAKAQITAKGYKMLPQVFYTSTSTGYCSSLNQSSLAIDGVQIWPTP